MHLLERGETKFLFLLFIYNNLHIIKIQVSMHANRSSAALCCIMTHCCVMIHKSTEVETREPVTTQLLWWKSTKWIQRRCFYRHASAGERRKIRSNTHWKTGINDKSGIQSRCCYHHASAGERRKTRSNTHWKIGINDKSGIQSRCCSRDASAGERRKTRSNTHWKIGINDKSGMHSRCCSRHASVGKRGKARSKLLAEYKVRHHLPPFLSPYLSPVHIHCGTDQSELPPYSQIQYSI